MTANKGWQGNFFEDFALEQRLACPTPRTLTDGDVAAYIAFTGDRTPRFCGPDKLVHPLISFHTVLGQTVRQISLNARANLGYAGMRWLAPVRVGDTLTTTARIVGLKENSSRDAGIVWVHTSAKHQLGEEVLVYTRWVMVKKRGEAPTPYLDSPVIPSVPRQVAAHELVPHLEALPRPSATGATWAFEDYRPDERVLHIDGTTVNRSDHMSFTRLFQNTAKVHFDEVLTSGRPLVYGGVPISTGYAQAFNGFENRLGLAALNGGTHANPIYAGDTLYSFTDVLECADLGSESPVGALRLRLVGVKNESPAQSDGFPIQLDDPERPGKKRYHPSVVLDLDFWELVPKRATLDALEAGSGHAGG
jgi:2-methylfumaryl-CoA hydratase